MESASFYQIDKNGIRLSVHAQPGASRSEFAGLHAGAIKIRVVARAEEGAANKSLCAFLAEFFDVPKTSVSILRGASSRQKTVLIEGESKKLLETLQRVELS